MDPTLRRIHGTTQADIAEVSKHLMVGGGAPGDGEGVARIDARKEEC